MHIHIKEDHEGDWAQMFVDGKLFYQDHYVRPNWYVLLLQEHFGVKITREECDLEE